MAKRRDKNYSGNKPNRADRPARGLSIVRGEGSLTVEVAPMHLPPPSRAMAASWATVRLRDEDVLFVFGQQHPASDQLVSALVISMTKRNAQKAFTPEFIEAMRKVHGDSAAPLPDANNIAWPNDKIVYERATIAGFAYVDNDAEGRFYRVSANDYQSIIKSAGSQPDLVHPVVEVHFSASLLYALAEEVFRITKE